MSTLSRGFSQSLFPTLDTWPDEAEPCHAHTAAEGFIFLLTVCCYLCYLCQCFYVRGYTHIWKCIYLCVFWGGKHSSLKREEKKRIWGKLPNARKKRRRNVAVALWLSEKSTIIKKKRFPHYSGSYGKHITFLHVQLVSVTRNNSGGVYNLTHSSRSRIQRAVIRKHWDVEEQSRITLSLLLSHKTRGGSLVHTGPIQLLGDDSQHRASLWGLLSSSVVLMLSHAVSPCYTQSPSSVLFLISFTPHSSPPPSPSLSSLHLPAFLLLRCPSLFF